MPTVVPLSKLRLTILTVNLAFSTFVFCIAARLYLLPRLAEISARIEGTVDLIAAITLATTYGAEPFMGPAYWIPAFWVPALLVTHFITFVVLVRY